MIDLLASLDRQGRGFELLCRWFLQNDPEFRAEYKEVWLWRDWPGRWGPDRGIDLVAVTFAGGTDAIQAKHYGLEHTVTKRDIDTFLSESNRRGIDVASADRFHGQARTLGAGGHGRAGEAGEHLPAGADTRERHRVAGEHRRAGSGDTGVSGAARAPAAGA